MKAALSKSRSRVLLRVSSLTKDKYRVASTRYSNNGVAIERLDVSAYTVPTDSPESDGTITWDKTTLVLVEATAGGITEPWLHLCRPGNGEAHQGTIVRRGHWSRCHVRTGNLASYGRVYSQSWSSRHRLNGHCRRGYRSLGSEGSPVTTATRHAVGCGTRERACLWQWRLHLLLTGATAKATGRLGCRRHSPRKNENRSPSRR